MPKRPPHFEVFRARNGHWYFREVAANGNKGARSSGSYSRRDAALRGVRRAFGPDIQISPPARGKR